MAAFLLAAALGDPAFGDGEAEFQFVAAGKAHDDVVDGTPEPFGGSRWGVVEHHGNHMGRRPGGAGGDGVQECGEGSGPTGAQLDHQAVRRMGGESGHRFLQGTGGGDVMTAVAGGLSEQVAGGGIAVDDQGADQIKTVGLHLLRCGVSQGGSGSGRVSRGTGMRHHAAGRCGLFDF